MAKTITLILALLITGATSYFSLTNLGKMKQERLTINKLEGDIDKAMKDIEDTRGVIATRRSEQDTENRKKGQQTADRDGLLGAVASLKAQIPQLEEKITTQTAQIKKFEDAIAELKKFFASMNVDDMEELNDRIKELANDTVAREKELAETQALVETAKASISKTEDQLSSARGRQLDRDRGLRANTAEAVIQAVNNDWGFVVINAGQNQGFRGDSALIVKRGETFVAKLNITSLSKTQMVADIQPNSLAKGMSVQPGDAVILQKTNR